MQINLADRTTKIGMNATKIGKKVPILADSSKKAAANLSERKIVRVAR